MKLTAPEDLEGPGDRPSAARAPQMRGVAPQPWPSRAPDAPPPRGGAPPEPRARAPTAPTGARGLSGCGRAGRRASAGAGAVGSASLRRLCCGATRTRAGTAAGQRCWFQRRCCWPAMLVRSRYSPPRGSPRGARRDAHLLLRVAPPHLLARIGREVQCERAPGRRLRAWRRAPTVTFWILGASTFERRAAASARLLLRGGPPRQRAAGPPRVHRRASAPAAAPRRRAAERWAARGGAG